MAQTVNNLPAMQETGGSTPELGKSPEEEHGNPLWYSCLENSMDRGAWWEPDTTEQLTHTHTHTHTHTQRNQVTL